MVLVFTNKHAARLLLATSFSYFSTEDKARQGWTKVQTHNGLCDSPALQLNLLQCQQLQG